jgi:hypothetical protein
MCSKEIIQKAQWARFMRFHTWYRQKAGGRELTALDIENTVVKF